MRLIRLQADRCCFELTAKCKQFLISKRVGRSNPESGRVTSQSILLTLTLELKIPSKQLFISDSSLGIWICSLALKRLFPTKQLVQEEEITHTLLLSFSLLDPWGLPTFQTVKSGQKRMGILSSDLEDPSFLSFLLFVGFTVLFSFKQLQRPPAFLLVHSINLIFKCFSLHNTQNF